MITEAYCYETDSIESAEIANAKRARGIEHHYFCAVPLRDCGLPVFAKQRRDTGTCFFESGDVEIHGHHAANCPHRRDQRVPPGGHDGGRDPGPRVIGGLVIPTILGDARPQQREWHEVTRPEIIQMARNAGPLLIPGNIEEVVSAFEEMPVADRAAHPLMIEGQWLNYDTAFQWVDDIVNVLASVEWRGKIVIGNGFLRPGKYDNVWLFSFNRAVVTGNENTRIRLVLRTRDFAGEISKNYIAGLPREGQRLKVYWHGEPPVLRREREQDHYYLQYTVGRPPHQHIAVRVQT